MQNKACTCRVTQLFIKLYGAQAWVSKWRQLTQVHELGYKLDLHKSSSS